ncbi:MAG: hypothetical protein LAO79_29775 [Acidobacteriia bacterium]|nr:hypothetical protein [Terriglobia bacterium]
MKPANLHLLWRDRAVLSRFRTGVSLHSHTLYSEESMAFVPRYTGAVPFVGHAIRQQERRYFERTGRPLDFSRAFWRPPLAPSEALELEKRQIEDTLDLDALVSLSDHDDIQAPVLLSLVDPKIPVSVEWTVPSGATFFHLGIHNIPARRAAAVMSELAAVTFDPRPGRIREMLAALNAFPETLVIWNHPCWDEARIGAARHADHLENFLLQFGPLIHALELNGLRPWSENRQVIRAAARSGHPLISGGDRHGLEPNANLNLTNAATFDEFVQEIRHDRHSDVLFMPQYREPLRARMIETMWDIVRDYPEFPADRRRWSDRVFYRQDDGVTRPLSAIWTCHEPWPVKVFLGGLRATKSPQVRSALRLALGFGLDGGQEIAS